MAKARKKKREKTPQKPIVQRDKKSFFSRHPVWITLGILIVLLLIFYHQIFFQGLTFQGSDALNSKTVLPFVKDSLHKGAFPLWCPYVFSGMPNYASMMAVPIVNIIDYAIIQGIRALHGALSLPMFLRLFLNYLAFGLLIYVMLRKQKLAKEACLLAAIAIVFLPQFIAFTAYGHNSKFLALVLIPLIFYLTNRVFTKPSISNFSLLALAVGFQLMRSHIQVTYYTFLLLGIYFVFQAVMDIKDKKGFKPIIINGELLIGSIVVGFLLASILYLPVYEYQHFSIRGGGASGGLDFDYASSWSFHPLEMVTFIIPSFMGFGGQTYWGKMPFTDYPLYMGIVVLLLAGVAFVLKRNRFTWFLSVVAIFSLFVSFGRHFGILYRPMYEWFPFFDKFRVPSMIHILLDISVVALSAIGLSSLLDFKQDDTKTHSLREKQLSRYLYIFLGIVGLLFLFVLLAKGSFINMVASSRAGMNEALRNNAYSMASADAFKALIFVGLAVALVIGFLKEKVGRSFLVIGLVSMVVIDLWWVDFKIINPSEPANEEAFFAKTPVVSKLQSDPSLFRLYPMYDDKRGNWYLYHLIQNVSGYHAAKLRIYQEFLEETGLEAVEPVKRAGSSADWRNVQLPQWPRLPHFLAKYWSIKMQNQQATWAPIPLELIPQNLLAFHHNVLDMLNVKYITSYHQIPDTRYRLVLEGQRSSHASLYENTTVLPRAFFVDTLEVLAGKERIFSRMKDISFNPRKLAIIEEKPEFAIESADSNVVSITGWENHRISLEATVVKPSLMVLSEVYYPAGWKCYVDGKETKIYKTNYILRSIFLTPGDHAIEFTFKSKTFIIGQWLSIGTLIVLLGLIAFGITRKTLAKTKTTKQIA